MVLYGIAFISDWSIGLGARAVSRKTPIYNITKIDQDFKWELYHVCISGGLADKLGFILLSRTWVIIIITLIMIYSYDADNDYKNDNDGDDRDDDED